MNAFTGQTPPDSIRFSPHGGPVRFEIWPRERRLLADGEPTSLGSRAFDLLLALVARPGLLLSKNELLDIVWHGLVVEEGNLAVQVSNLRKVLGGDVLATIPGRGYRFTAVVAAAPAAPNPPARPEVETVVAGPAPSQHPTHLPATLTPLLGRDDELRTLHHLVDEHRLVTVLGAGGMGKTLLSQHLLRGRERLYRHGVCFVELAKVSDAAGLPAAIAQALALQLGVGDAVAGLCKALSPLDLLLVLDNAEHLLEPVAALAAALLAATPNLRLVVTSQAPLRLGAELVHRLMPLAVPTGAVPLAEARRHGAVALFEARARAADSRFALTEASVATAITIVRELDGLALAIELAAARAPTLGLMRLAQSLGERLQLLTRGGRREAPARQQTLRAALAWSHALLGPDEQVVFRRLAALPDATGLDMLQAIVADLDPAPAAAGNAPQQPGTHRLDRWAVLDALCELVDRSLVVVEPGVAHPSQEMPDQLDHHLTRYRLLDTPRALALEHLAAAGEQPALRRRHAQVFSAWARRESEALGTAQLSAAEVLADHVHLCAALDEAIAQQDDEMALDLLPSVLLRAVDVSQAEVRRLRQVLTQLIQGDALPAGRLVMAAFACARAGAGLSDSPRGRIEWNDRGLALLAQLPTAQRPAPLSFTLQVQLGHAWTEIAMSQIADGDAAAATLQAVSALGQAEGYLAKDAAYTDLLQLLHLRVGTAACRGRHEEALQHARREEEIARAHGFGWGGWMGWASTLDVMLTAGRFEEALAFGLGVLSARQGSRDERRSSVLRLNTAAAGLALGRLDLARELAQAAWPAALRFGHHPWWADNLALLLALEGRLADAARVAGYADAAYATQDDLRQANEAAAVARARALANAALGDTAVAALEAEGAALGDGAAGLLVFGAAPG